jgi:hypothetical protein
MLHKTVRPWAAHTVMCASATNCNVTQVSQGTLKKYAKWRHLEQMVKYCDIQKLQNTLTCHQRRLCQEGGRNKNCGQGNVWCAPLHAWAMQQMKDLTRDTCSRSSIAATANNKNHSIYGLPWTTLRHLMVCNCVWSGIACAEMQPIHNSKLVESYSSNNAPTPITNKHWRGQQYE